MHIQAQPINSTWDWVVRLESVPQWKQWVRDRKAQTSAVAAIDLRRLAQRNRVLEDHLN